MYRKASGVNTARPAVRGYLAAVPGGTRVLAGELGAVGWWDRHVSLAYGATLGRDVALQVLAPELGAGVRAERLRREAASPPDCVFPASCRRSLRAGTAAGESVYMRLDRAGALAVGDGVRPLRELADALAHAHYQGWVHRPPWPDIVPLGGGYEVVTDLGTAKALTAATLGIAGCSEPEGRGWSASPSAQRPTCCPSRRSATRPPTIAPTLAPACSRSAPFPTSSSVVSRLSSAAAALRSGLQSGRQPNDLRRDFVETSRSGRCASRIGADTPRRVRERSAHRRLDDVAGRSAAPGVGG